MAGYKVLQDIEADDKLLGPLSLKQFIFAIITIVLLFIEFRLITSGSLGVFKWVFLLILLPPTALFGVLSAPLGRDQPTEIWLIARLQFFLKPRRRVWDQSGIKELVTITVPKRIEVIRSKNISQNEAKSRLQALADTVDSRGWAVKNVNIGIADSAGYEVAQDDDRLTGGSVLPQAMSNIDIQASDDIMDATSNAVAQNFENMIHESEAEHRHEIEAKMTAARERTKSNTDAAADYWFLNQESPEAAPKAPKGYVVGGGGQTVTPTAEHENIASPSDDEQALAERIKRSQQQASQYGGFAHLKTISPLGEKKQEQSHEQKGEPTGTPAAPASPPPVNPAIIQLAQDNDKNVATLAREASRDNDQHLPGNEVTISLR